MPSYYTIHPTNMALASHEAEITLIDGAFRTTVPKMHFEALLDFHYHTQCLDRKVATIKLYRAFFKVDLRTAKAIIDATCQMHKERELQRALESANSDH